MQRESSSEIALEKELDADIARLERENAAMEAKLQLASLLMVVNPCGCRGVHKYGNLVTISSKSSLPAKRTSCRWLYR